MANVRRSSRASSRCTAKLSLPRLSRPLLFELLEPRTVLAASFVISEFMADNNGGLKDTYGSASDWVEIHNQGDSAGRCGTVADHPGENAPGSAGRLCGPIDLPLRKA